jgi:DNA polymerase-3 subunit delta'
MSGLPKLLPWHREIFGRMMKLQDQNRLGHAWLFSGLEGMGKLTFARYLAQSLLCEAAATDNRPCCECKSCLLFQGGNHPDWQLVQPEKSLIKIEQIREQLDFANQTSQRGGMKILVIKPAEAMNLNAANALLKMLEEPPPGTLLILVSHQPGLLLPTLRSRCQHLRCPVPPTGMAAEWLNQQGYAGNAERILGIANGAPLLALHLTESGVLAEQESIGNCLVDLASGATSVLHAARECEKFSTLSCIAFVMQVIRCALGQQQAGLSCPDPELQSINQVLNSKAGAMALHSYYRKLLGARKDCLAPNNANQLLILEDLLAGWRTLTTTGRQERHGRHE